MDQDNNDNDESLEYLTVDVSSSEEGEHEDDFPSRTQTNLMMAGIEVLSHSSRFEEEEVYLSWL